MISSIATVIVASAAAVSAGVISKRGQSISVTPHDQYSSTIGVIGGMINANRVAYWPTYPSCDNICVKVSYQGRSLNLLHIDKSGGAHDISYDAWNYLVSGKSAKESPQTGGGITMEYEDVPADDCKDLLHNDKLPLIAVNGMSYIGGCDKNSWAVKNYEFYNLADTQGTSGWDELCTLDLAVSNQPKCPHTLGGQNKPTGVEVVNIQYGTGKEVKAT
ncbi:cerato-platanin like protein [Metarhizium robertsii]|uniref:Cerato-platanin n=2 Tax=Metarhizium robertsii TaxID=568076 RepID=E9F6Y5_METRA|nr:Cerato-platanin [Metarhizium robertsii ARSEF 23]EFY96537.1 Cerato-platanin [Metarhizium robertsii ARSEF 23]EXU98185.1 cerato-platanin like protein [Metarhizium robertsii]